MILWLLGLQHFYLDRHVYKALHEEQRRLLSSIPFRFMTFMNFLKELNAVTRHGPMAQRSPSEPPKKTQKETARGKPKEPTAKQQRTRHDKTRKTNDSQTNTHASIHAHSKLAYIAQWFFEPSLIFTPSRSGRKMA